MYIYWTNHIIQKWSTKQISVGGSILTYEETMSKLIFFAGACSL